MLIGLKFSIWVGGAHFLCPLCVGRLGFFGTFPDRFGTLTDRLGIFEDLFALPPPEVDSLFLFSFVDWVSRNSLAVIPDGQMDGSIKELKYSLGTSSLNDTNWSLFGFLRSDISLEHLILSANLRVLSTDRKCPIICSVDVIGLNLVT